MDGQLLTRMWSFDMLVKYTKLDGEEAYIIIVTQWSLSLDLDLKN